MRFSLGSWTCKWGKWVWLKSKQEGPTAGFGPCFHLPGFHFGTGFLSHSQMACLVVIPYLTRQKVSESTCDYPSYLLMAEPHALVLRICSWRVGNLCRLCHSPRLQAQLLLHSAAVSAPFWISPGYNCPRFKNGSSSVSSLYVMKLPQLLFHTSAVSTIL